MSDEKPSTDELERARLNKKIRDSVTRTAAMMADRKELNDRIAEEREKICEETGLHPRAYQDEVRNFRIYTPGERADYMSSRKVMTEAMTGHEADLFGEEEIRARDERAAKRAEKKDKTAPGPDGKIDPDEPDNPRGDPNTGGAAEAHRQKLQEAEQEEGGQVLDEAIAGMNAKAQAPVDSGEEPAPEPAPKAKASNVHALPGGKKKSQSQIAADKRAAAKMN